MQVYSEQMSDSICVPRIPPDGQESAALLRNAELNGFSNVNGGGSVLMVGTIDRNNLMLHRSKAAGEHTLPRPAVNANQFSTMPRNNHTTTFQVINWQCYFPVSRVKLSVTIPPTGHPDPKQLETAQQ